MRRRTLVGLGLTIACFLAQPLAAQSRQVTGTVTRSSGAPIAEATIGLVGTTSGTRSSADGRFTISVPAGPARLAVRAIGFVRREVALTADQATVTVALTDDIFKLDEVVITGQATTIEKRSATTATVSLGADEITRAPAQSLEQALQGKILGATVTMNGGGPGGGAQIQIRGSSSVLGNSQPLYVIDGTIISNDAFSGGLNTVSRASGTGAASAQDNLVNRLADLNPNEIESIEVLKSAAATAIYGSRATNGVVVVRTKRGTAGQTRVNLTQRVGTQEPLRLIPARTFTSVRQVQAIPFGNTGAPGGVISATNAATTFLNNTFPSGIIPLAANQDYQKQFYDNRSPSHETVASVSGGSDQFQYFLSAGNRREVGIAPKTGATLQTIRFNGDQLFKNGVKLSASFNITRNNLDRGIAGNDNTCTSPMYCIPYIPGVVDLQTVNAQGAYPINPFNGGGNRASNWFQTFEFLRYNQDIWRQLGSLNLSYAPVTSEQNTVTLAVLGGLDRYQQAAYLLSPSFLQYEGGVDGLLGRVAQSSVDAFNYNTQFSALWTSSAIKGVSLNTSVGASLERQSTNNYLVRARGTLPGQETVQQGTLDATQAITAFRDQAIFANEQLQAFDEKLTVSGGVRADRSSANGDPSKFYVFPRASASYNLGAVTSFVSSLKLRSGWGQTGNRPRYGDRDVFGNSVLIGGQQGVGVTGTIGNPAIRPETLTELEGGIDATFLKERVSLEATYYRRNITNQLLNPALPASSGYGALIVNAGELRNEGAEIGLTLVPVNSGTVQWTFTTSFQKNLVRVTNLPSFVSPFNPSAGNANSMRPQIVNGQKATLAWGNVPYYVNTDGSLSEAPIGARLIPLPAGVGSIVTRDTIIGDINPDFQMFFNNSVTFKSLTLGFTLDWRKGGLVYNFTQRLFDEGGTAADWGNAASVANAPRGSRQDVINQLTYPTNYLDYPERNGVYPAGLFRYLAAGPSTDARVYSQLGTYLRLRDLSLSFDAGPTLARAIGGRSLRFSAQGRNLLMFTPWYTGFDPENNRQGNQNIRQAQELAPFPGARQVFLSVDVGF
jgi:TonB-linked SusC/RagA family outer membrane protein